MKRTWVVTSATIVAVVVAIALLFVCVARAADDGGSRSVFSFGAGNRALGLGGAYGAVADDASSPLWNPAGLALVRRTEFQGSQTDYFGLGIDEQYASLVLPSWRYGVASVTFRHFGVGGIERRDDRNILIDSDLSNNETEFSVGYGRQVGSWWNVGGVVKVRHQSIAEFAGSGIGVDLGVVGRPLRALIPNNPSAGRLSVGVTLRNIVEPRIRLDSDYVPDPAGVRLATAYVLPVFGGRNVLAAVDLEKTRRTNARFHAGMEFAVHPMLTLRAGANGTALTAGSGMRWNNVTLDYAYEDTPLGGVHRVGVDFTFGATVDERQQLAIQAEETALQERLAEAFERRQAERIAELLAVADSSMNAGRFSEALTPLAAVTALDAANSASRARQSRCLVEIAKQREAEGDYASAIVGYSRALDVAPNDPEASAGYHRCRDESNRIAERTQEVRRQFLLALDAFSRDDLLEAERDFDAILRVDPNDEEAATMLRRTRAAITQRSADKIAEAERMVEWGRLDEARTRLAEARALQPNASGLASAEAKLEKRSAELAQASHNPARPTDASVDPSTHASTITEEERREIERLYKSGVDAMSQERSEDAIHYFELVWSVDPQYQRVSEHLKREYMMRGMEFFSAGKLEKAVESWENARRIDPDDERVAGYLSRAREQVARTKQILGEDR